jgi:putative ABC transport system permease protein
MLKNYFLIGLRNLLRAPLFSSINIIGLVMGITCSTIILIYAWREVTHDHYHTKANNIYRITLQQKDKDEVGAVTPGPLAPELKAQFPEIVNTARLGKWSGVFKTNEVLFSEGNVFFADNSLLHIFDFPLTIGDSKTALIQPNHLLLSESMALKYFGKDWSNRSDLIGTTFRLNNEADFVAVGVFKDQPAQSSLHFDFLLSFEYLVPDRWSYNWGSHNFNTFVELAPGHPIQDFNAKIKDVLIKRDPQAGFTVATQSVKDMYLHPLGYDYWTKQGNLAYIKIFTIIGIGILLIACFNFINLATAQSSKRSKEVGIRKTIGATRTQIFIQFLGESIAVVLIAAIISRGLIDLLLPYFSNLIGTEITLSPISYLFSLALLAFTLLIGFLASVYPAARISAMNPVKSLKGMMTGRNGKSLRETLVIAQFCLSFLLMVGAVVIYQQVDYVQGKELGFDKEQVMFIGLGGSLREKSETFREELLKQAEVDQAAATTSILVNNENYSNIEWEGQLPGQEVTITQMNANPHVIPLMDMKMVYGRNFSEDIKSDTVGYIINETASRQMGFQHGEAIGKRTVFWGLPGSIIGVVKDFNFRPLSMGIEPFIMRYRPKEFYFNMLVKVKPNQVASLIEKLPALYKKFDAENPLSYGFVDERLNMQYQNEQRALSIVLHFCALSVIITCLGLFGLATFVAEQRTKEIGIRKVLGGSVQGIVVLLSKDFMRPMLIAVLIGTPIGWYLLNQWLAGYVYRIELTAAVFAATGMLSVLVAWLTVSSRAIQTARANPVDSLRSE